MTECHSLKQTACYLGDAVT